MNNLTVGISKPEACNLEEFLLEDDLDYFKEVKGDKAYFHFNSDWDTEFSSEVMTYLITIVGVDSYSLIRMGEAMDDIEIQGTPTNFGMGITRRVEIQ